MISVVVAVRNNRRFVGLCLDSLARAIAAANVPVEYILVDDNSEPDQDIPALFRQFRGQVGPGPAITVLRFTVHQHYTRALAYGFSAARGDYILFVSHDMLVTADWVSTLLAVAESDPSLGIVRGVANYVDGRPEWSIKPPLPIRNPADLDAFARYVRAYHGLTRVEDPVLVGDGMLIRRQVINKVGVFDPRYFGYFGDGDYSLRVQRAGFGLACALGAWLWHDGEGAYKDQHMRTGGEYQAIHDRRMKVVGEAYRLFREKWDPTLPPEYPGFHGIDFPRLRAGPPPAGGEYQPPLTPDASICQVSHVP